MICRNPYVTPAGSAFPCGSCEPCRHKRQGVWVQRICYEMSCWPVNNSVTLTYDDDNVPADGSLCLRDVQLFLKRLRLKSERLRFFCVGEYGEKYERPHYHLILFNSPYCRYLRTRPLESSCCDVCDTIARTWKMGRISSQYCDEGSAKYLTKYVLKGMTHRDDERLAGREPEFSRMSLRPGIGAGFIDRVAQTMIHPHYARWYDEEIDVPGFMLRGKSKVPMGRYLRRRLRIATGRDVTCPQESFDLSQEKVQAVRMAAFENQTPGTLKSQLVDAGEQEYRNLMARLEIYRQRGNQ